MDDTITHQEQLLLSFLQTEEKFCIDILSLNILLGYKERYNLSRSFQNKKYKENEDYIVNSYKNPTGGKDKIDFILTKDCFFKFIDSLKADKAKEIKDIINKTKHSNNLSKKVKIIKKNDFNDSNKKNEKIDDGCENDDDSDGCYEDISNYCKNSNDNDLNDKEIEEEEKYDIDNNDNDNDDNDDSENENIEDDIEEDNSNDIIIFSSTNVGDFINKSAIYLLKVNDNTYKFGNTDSIIHRFDKHKKNLKFIEIINIWDAINKTISMKIERKLKKLIKYNPKFKLCNNSLEMFQTDNIDIFINYLLKYFYQEYQEFKGQNINNNVNINNKEYSLNEVIDIILFKKNDEIRNIVSLLYNEINDLKKEVKNIKLLIMNNKQCVMNKDEIKELDNDENTYQCHHCKVYRDLSEFTEGDNKYVTCKKCRESSKKLYNIGENQQRCSGCTKVKDKTEFTDGKRHYMSCNICREKDRNLKNKQYQDPEMKEKKLLKNQQSYVKHKDKIILQKKEYLKNKAYEYNRCLKCNKDLPDEYFDKHEDGALYSTCKECLLKDKEQKKLKNKKVLS
jgi:predicted GIY-YIG superfamily endonuclease